MTLRGFNRERVLKSREAMLSAVEIYNNPNCHFKAESFIALAIISWTYLMHAYLSLRKVDVRYSKGSGTAKRYMKTKRGAYKFWELETCLDCKLCPIDRPTQANLRFLIGIRHEIEHQLTHSIDDQISAKLQACAQNYNHWLCTLFGDEWSIADSLALAIQFSAIDPLQVSALSDSRGLSKSVRNYIASFEANLDEAIITDARSAYRVVFVGVNVNRKGQADRAIEFVPAGSDLAKGLNAEYAVIKETEKEKYLPGDVVRLMHDVGYGWFTMNDHTNLWKDLDAKVPGKGYGVFVGKQWYWYRAWVDTVTEWCVTEDHVRKLRGTD